MKLPNNEPYHPSQSITNLLGRSYSLILKQLSVYLKEQNLPVTADQLRILSFLWKKDGCSQQSLANQSHRNRANITRHIDSLERLELLRRERDQNDRRIYHIYLTEAGRELESEAISCSQQAVADATKDIKEDELAICFKVLEQTIANLS